MTDTDETLITVADMKPPTLTVSLDPPALWPPNHRMVDVHAAVQAIDACSSASVALSSVTSSEADDGKGDGNTINDIQGVQYGTADLDFSLRAERASGGTGRSYTVVYTAMDGNGNMVSVADTVTVPHDLGGVIEPVSLSVEEAQAGAVVTWDEVIGARAYDVIRGDVSDIAEAGMLIGLGSVMCIENDSVDGSTSGSADVEAPSPGRAYFYLVRFFDGRNTAYGTESADKPRAIASGDCP